MTKIEFHTEAQLELEDAHAWYKERSELAARAFAAEIDYAIRSISMSPGAWPQTGSNEHRFFFQKVSIFDYLSLPSGCRFYYGDCASKATTWLLA
jgi:plasmid stabilization system protein ParE